ncbi:MAG: hydantoinase/carbamoylase family amidase [Solirubrobacteraceae bacterium]
MPDRDRVAERLDALWRIAKGPAGGADRPAFSAAEAQAMGLVAGWAQDAGLAPGIDPFGNLWALPAGWEGPLVTAGSHVDTVPDGGRFDGALGTVLGLELVDALRDGTSHGARPGLLVCAAEEAPRFGAGTIGSRLLAGTLAPDALHELRDATGITAHEAQESYLRALAELPRVEPVPARLRAHVEIHIAQRRSLDVLGVVERVAAPRRALIELTGEAGHAGEVAMEVRHDALAAAAEIVLAIERAAQAEPPATVATVGSLDVEPGAVSVIPGGARLALDLRGIDARSIERLESAIAAAVKEIAGRRGVAASTVRLRGGDPVSLDAELIREATDAARRLAIPLEPTWSGAGHDAQHLAALAPTLLLFVPLRGGESHTPREGADADDIERAMLVAIDVLGGR